ncbi:MAG: hypothetical protein ABII79_12025 [bacterium]
MHDNTAVKWTGSVLTVLAVLLLVSPVQSQIRFGQPTYGDVQIVYSHWSLKQADTTTEINQMTIPVTGFVPLKENVEAIFYIVSSSNTLKASQTDFSLSGMGDARMQVNHSFMNDQLLLSLGVNMPTGKKKLTIDEELLVVQVLSQNYLSFPMRRFGEGFGFSALLGGAQMLGDLRCGVGVMYQVNGEYEPYAGSDKYDPGDVLSVNATADWQNDRTTVTSEMIFAAYGADKFAGSNAFKQSTQLTGRLRVVHKSEAFDAGGGLSYLARGRNSFFYPNSTQRLFGNEFMIDANLTRGFAEHWRFTPTAEIRMISAAENNQPGTASIVGLGGTVGRTFGSQTTIAVGGKYFTGDADGGNIDLSGFQINANLTVSM